MQADDLIKQRDASSNGIIALDDASFSKYADRSDRSYSLVVFFTAKGKESPQLKMKEIFDNFALVAKHVKKKAGDREHQAAANKVFFTTLEFSQSQRSFAQLGVKAIPWVLHLRPGLSSACVPAQHIAHHLHAQRHQIRVRSSNVVRECVPAPSTRIHIDDMAGACC